MRNDDGGSRDNGVGFQKFQIVFFRIIREENEGLGGDGESIVNFGAARVGEDVDFDVIGEAVDVSRHRGEVFIEGASRVGVFGEENEVFRSIPEGDECEECPDYEECAYFHSRRLTAYPFAKPQKRHRGDKEDEGLSADRAKGVREPFFGQEFRNEHSRESAEEEECDQEVAIAIGVFPTTPREEEESHYKKDASREEERARHEVEEGIGRVVVAPVHIADEGVLDKGERESFPEGKREIPVIHVGRKNRDGGGARGEVLGMCREFVNDGRGCDRHTKEKDERVFPIELQKSSVGSYASERRDDEDEGRHAEGNIGVETETEDESGKEERNETFGAESAKEKVEGKREKERYHDGAKADTGKVDRPVGKRHEKSGKERDAPLVPEFFREEIDAEDGECPENGREEFERGDAIPKKKERKGLQVDEEPFATIIVGIEPSVFAGLIGTDRIDAVHRLVWIEPGGNVFDIPEAKKKRRREKHDQDGCRDEFFIRKEMSEEMSLHSLIV